MYGISSSEFAASRGRILMSEPAIVEREDGFLIGSNFPEREGTKPYQRAAYWIGQTFPEVEDFDRICGSAYSLAAWTEWDGQPRYYLGPWVKEIGYVPENMDALRLPGGTFAAFPVPESGDNSILWEDMWATWYFALSQWLPESEWERDESRIAFEYYFTSQRLNATNYVYVPVKPRAQAAAPLENT